MQAFAAGLDRFRYRQIDISNRYFFAGNGILSRLHYPGERRIEVLWLNADHIGLKIRGEQKIGAPAAGHQPMRLRKGRFSQARIKQHFAGTGNYRAFKPSVKISICKHYAWQARKIDSDRAVSLNSDQQMLKLFTVDRGLPMELHQLCFDIRQFTKEGPRAFIKLTRRAASFFLKLW